MTRFLKENPVIDAVIPVYKPDERLGKILEVLARQELPVRTVHLMVTVPKGGKMPALSVPTFAEVHPVPEKDFDHGATRNLGASFSDADYLLYLTQDAVPADSGFTAALVRGFSGEKTAAVYARQLPREGAKIPEQLTQAFNYPAEERVQNLETLEKLGVKTYFCSNAASMYDRQVFETLGGFVDRTIFNEDMIYAYGLVQAGYTIRYVPEATVVHSHNYTGKQLFRRNFDLGVSQADHPEIFETVSSEKEGKKLVKTVLKELLKRGKIFSIVRFIYQCGMKYLGYRTGKRYRTLPEKKILKYTMNRNYWEKEHGTD